MHGFWRGKLRKKNASRLESTEEVIEKVYFHSKDVDLNSSNIKNKLIFLSGKSEGKILNLHGFWHGKLRKKTRLDWKVQKKWLKKYIFIPKMWIWILQISKKGHFCAPKSEGKIIDFASFLTWKIEQKTRVQIAKYAKSDWKSTFSYQRCGFAFFKYKKKSSFF